MFDSSRFNLKTDRYLFDTLTDEVVAEGNFRSFCSHKGKLYAGEYSKVVVDVFDQKVIWENEKGAQFSEASANRVKILL